MTDPTPIIDRRKSGDERLENLFAILETRGIDLSTVEGRTRLGDDLTWAHMNRRRCDKILGWGLLITLGGVASVIGAWLLHGAENFFKGGGS